MTVSRVEWFYNPWRDRPGRAALALVAALTCCLVTTSLRLPMVPTLLLCVLSVTTLAGAFVPVRCRLDERGVMCGSGWMAERRRWEQLQRVVRGRDGLLLSPYRQRHWLDSYRALFLPLPRGADAPEAEALDHLLSSHGL